MEDTPSDETHPRYFVPLIGKTPSLIADLRSIAADLSYAGDLFARVAVTDTESDGDVRRALWDAGVAAYQLAFAAGQGLLGTRRMRSVVPPSLVDALEPLRGRDDRVLEFAEKDAAPVSDGKQARVFLVLSNPASGKSIEGVVCPPPRVADPDAEFALAASETARRFAAPILATVEELEAATIKEARTRDIDDVYGRALPIE